MPTFTCVNLPGHYEGNGLEVNVFPTQIVVTFKGGYQNQKPQKQQQRHDDKPQQKDDGNMSLISSGMKIAKMFGKK